MLHECRFSLIIPFQGAHNIRRDVKINLPVEPRFRELGTKRLHVFTPAHIRQQKPPVLLEYPPNLAEELLYITVGARCFHTQHVVD